MFFNIRAIDILDIFLVAILFFQLYRLIRGTVALKIFFGLFSLIVFWLLVNALKMELLGSILNALISVGAIAIIVLFQSEIRSFLLLVGSRYKFGRWFSTENVLASNRSGMLSIYINPIVTACHHMSDSKTGALIIITNQSDLVDITKTGELLNANISSSLIESIFFKNSPLHDGAVIINKNKIKAASCILPLSHNTNLPKNLGLRHRAGLGVSQSTDAQVIIVSEETGSISYCFRGELHYDLTIDTLKDYLKKNSD
jgi:diadenylate cyclase